MNERAEKFYCPECGVPTEVLEEGRTSGMRCPNCGWSVVTTNFLPIEQDAIIYEISINFGNYCDQRQIKLISQLTGCNFLQARKILQGVEATVYKGKAPQVLVIKQELMAANLSVTIKPEFCW